MKAMVLGGTGATGQALIKELLSQDCDISAITRHPLESPSIHNTVTPDLSTLPQYAFASITDVFCCIGTTRSKSGAAAFVSTDHDLVLDLARKAHAAGVTRFHLVSSVGANPSSWFLYPQTKGRLEVDIKGIGFDTLVIYRPALLLCERKEWRWVEAFARRVIAPVVELLLPGRFAISCDNLAKAMVRVALDAEIGNNNVRIVENQEIYKIALK